MKWLGSIAFAALCSLSHAYAQCESDFTVFTRDKLRILTETYHPEKTGIRYRPPQFRELYASEQSIFWPALANTFAIAPLFFRQYLCALDYIFIDPNASSPGGWGFWAGDADQWGPVSQHWPQNAIGVSASLWINKPDYATYETTVSSALKQKNWKLWVGPPTYTQATTGFLQPQPAGFEYTLLGILAHEAGHVIWRDQDQFRLQRCYLSWSEVASRKDDHDRFHGFGILARQSKSGRRSSFQEIYRDGEWASLFAAVGPDEDFIETYKLIVLNYSSPRLESLIVVDAAPGASVDMMAQFRNFSTNLNKKQSCFATALNALP